ncbi:MAG: hypothetical protein DRN15_01855 [Thermoprotei archaeon]|nr:MAG: hypothetical protein DRM97_04285 [Thermoprotei archaeon]RLF24708.1 MAG: hypothetical protein DRN15_01855 [Thermoprotei archaeon]
MLLIWLITSRCTMNCLHCYAKIHCTVGELNTTKAIKVIEEAADYGVRRIVFTGGEPLVRQDIWKLVRTAREHSMEVAIITSGWLLSSEVLELASRYDVEFYLSLESMLEEVHDMIRGTGSWRRTMKAIRELEREGIEYSLITTLSKLNKNSAWKVPLELAPSVEWCDGFSFIPVLPSGNALKRRELLLDSKELIDIAMKLDEVSRMVDVRAYLWCMSFIKRYVRRLYVGSCRRSNVIDLDPAGNVLLCDTLSLRLANVVEMGFAKAIKKAEESPVQRILEETVQLEPCRGCSLRQFCLGGCYVRAFQEFGDIGMPDPLCPLVRRSLIHGAYRKSRSRHT